jgi:hypothetical protein
MTPLPTTVARPYDMEDSIDAHAVLEVALGALSSGRRPAPKRRGDRMTWHLQAGDGGRRSGRRGLRGGAVAASTKKWVTRCPTHGGCERG